MLIDTNALIWYGLEPQRLSKRAIALMRKPRNFYSHVSLWEMAIKSGSGKLELRTADGQRANARQFMSKMIRPADSVATRRLPALMRPTTPC